MTRKPGRHPNQQVASVFNSKPATSKPTADLGTKAEERLARDLARFDAIVQARPKLPPHRRKP